MTTCPVSAGAAVHFLVFLRTTFVRSAKQANVEVEAAGVRGMGWLLLTQRQAGKDYTTQRISEDERQMATNIPVSVWLRQVLRQQRRIELALGTA